MEQDTTKEVDSQTEEVDVTHTPREKTSVEDANDVAWAEVVEPASLRQPPEPTVLTTVQAVALGIGIGVCLRAIFK